MHAFEKVLCQGEDQSDKWPLNRVYDGIPQALAERQTSVNRTRVWFVPLFPLYSAVGFSVAPFRFGPFC